MEIYFETDPAEKAAIAAMILADLPEWFGIPESTQEYIDSARQLVMIAVKNQGEPVGFLTLRNSSGHTAEIDCMGILKQYQGQGIGQQLVVAAMKWARDQRLAFIQVKTLGEEHPDPYYRRTRCFYRKNGFLDVETNQLWGAANPCLQMIQSTQEKGEG